MLRYDFEDSMGYWVFSVAHLMTRAMNDELGKLGITYRQWEVLCWLSYMGEITQSELADHMRIEAPTLVGVIDRMDDIDEFRQLPDDLPQGRRVAGRGDRHPREARILAGADHEAFDVVAPP